MRSMAVGWSSVCVMCSTLAAKEPSSWFNSTVTSWANIGSRDLHLDLRDAVSPGTRGVRELLLDALREAVRSGRLAAGTVLPPSRTLAADLGLARNTVAEAYAELVAEGWLASRQGAGTWVVNSRAAPLPARPRGVPGIPTHNLLPGSPDVAEFPRTAWLASTRRALAGAPHEALRMGDPRGPIAVETYGLFLFREALAAVGVATTPIGVDDRGAIIDDLEEGNARAALLTPAHH